MNNWKTIPDFPQYEVSDDGLVRTRAGSAFRVIRKGKEGARRVVGRLLRPIMRKGYWTVNLSQSGRIVIRSIHSLVLEAFVGPCPEGMQCCHWDDDKTNNHVSNLRWDTNAANSVDARRNGRLSPCKGESSGKSKLTEAAVIAIRKALKMGRSRKAIAREWGVSKSNIDFIAWRRTWRHVA